jgi:pilus assembly protein CpaB
MRRSRIIVLVIALAAGGIAAMLASGSRAPAPAPPPPPLATTDVLVAKADLNTGQVINEGDLGWQTWPAASASSALVRKSDRPDAIKEFVGALVRSPIVAGEPIRDSKVVLARGGGFMAAVLPHGMRAIALDITAASSCRTIIWT